MVEFVVLPLKGYGKHMPRTRHQEGYVEVVGKKPKQWQGVFYVYVTVDGKELRRKWTKILGPVMMPKHEAKKLLREHIEATTGQRGAISQQPTFREIWGRYSTLKAAKWSVATARSTMSVFKKAVLPVIGDMLMKDLSFDPLQAMLNGMAKVYGMSALNKARTYLYAVCEYAIDEAVIGRNPARKLETPRTRKSCERVYSMDEVGKLFAASDGRAHLVLRLAYCLRTPTWRAVRAAAR